MRTLFRREALGSAGPPPLGTILLARPLSHTVLTIGFAAVTVASLAFLATFSYGRKQRLVGELRPTQGVVEMHASQRARVASVAVADGQNVSEGDVLLVLRTDRDSATASTVDDQIIEMLDAQRSSYRFDLDAIHAQAERDLAEAQARRVELLSNLATLNTQIDMQLQRVAIAETATARDEDLQRSGFLSSARAQTSRSDVIDQHQRLLDLQRTRAAVQRDLRAEDLKLQQLPKQKRRDLAATRRSVTAVDQSLLETRARRELVVRATRTGVVTHLDLKTGDVVAEGQLIAQVVSIDEHYEIVVEAPSNAVGLLEENAKLAVTIEAFPAARFGTFHTRIASISRADTVAASAASASRSVYKVRAPINPAEVTSKSLQGRLRPGMEIHAVATLEERSLISWLFDPIMRASREL